MQSFLLGDIIKSILSKGIEGEAKHFALVGLDGFIDKIQHPVLRQDKSGSTFYNSLDQFGARISEAAGQSAQIELHTNTVKLGGNAPIFSNALANLGVANSCLGTFGYPQIHPVFQKIHDDSELITLGDAAETNALEFNDGKLILSELSTFANLNWKTIKERTDVSRLLEKYQKADLVALVDWCNLVHATDIWKGVLYDLVKHSGKSSKKFFFDLADPSKKSDHEIDQVISVINEFAKYGEVTLGLNENEANRIADFFTRQSGKPAQEELLSTVGTAIFRNMAIDQLLVHPIDGCLLTFSNGQTYLNGRVVEKPEVSTGGGDNFNAGYCFGMLNQFEHQESMVLAMAASGAYVEHGFSPDKNLLKNYLANWLQELEKPGNNDR